MNNHKRTLILMAAYNGEKYIKQQIDSIINQTDKDWDLWIRDDGSNDNTVNIIKNIQKYDNRIRLFQNTTDVHGAYHNFYALIREARNSNYEYYAFSDQDDLWKEDKLKQEIDIIRNSDEPALVYADMEVIDENNHVIMDSIDKVMGISNFGKENVFFAHAYIWGGTTVFNRKLMSMLEKVVGSRLPNESVMAHDSLLMKLALSTGKVHFCNTPTIRYRRHSANVTAGDRINMNLKKIMKRVLDKNNSVPAVHALVYGETLTFIYQMKINNIDSKINLDKMQEAILNGGIKGVGYLLKINFKRKQVARTIGTYLIMLTGKYKKYLFEYKKELKF
ncbi:glycosyltransferase family 2 protein [Ligilactobacillus agilis]|uniref:glycosyltransferase family 2 protein n=1 Tax=Ligilactobacillus agilis TaxID=1601 RepID=UPI000B8DB293|nr:glycosyltransferase family 2 protein [Ligilactobacillus agilis]ASR40902.1 hypothetical protein BEN83_05125 [Ligilactobacillus agilis]